MVLLNKSFLLWLIFTCTSLCANVDLARESIIRFYEYLSLADLDDPIPQGIISFQESFSKRIKSESLMCSDQKRVWHWLIDNRRILGVDLVDFSKRPHAVLWSVEFFNPKFNAPIETGRMHINIYLQVKPGGAAFKVISFPVDESGVIFLDGIVVNGVILNPDTLPILGRMDDQLRK